MRVVTANQKDTLCEPLGVVNTEQALGPGKQANAMNKALNEVARRGGNGIYVVQVGAVGLDGAAVTAEALRCKL